MSVLRRKEVAKKKRTQIPQVRKVKKKTQGAINKSISLKKRRKAGLSMAQMKKQGNQKKKALAEQKIKQATMRAISIKRLDSFAKEINVRLEKAAVQIAKADDHRLAAALQLGEAQRECKVAKIPFKKWAEEHVSKSFREIRKLVAIAAAPNPTKALSDLRVNAAHRNRQLKKRQKVKLAKVTEAPTVEDIIESMGDDETLDFVSSQAESLGMKVVSEADAEKLETLQLSAPKDEKSQDSMPLTLKELESGFAILMASDKLAFVRWAAEEIGVQVTGDFQETTDVTPVPDFLKKKKKVA